MPDSNGNKVMAALQSHSLRGLVDNINAAGISKDDIVSIIPHEGAFFLLYYK